MFFNDIACGEQASATSSASSHKSAMPLGCLLTSLLRAFGMAATLMQLMPD